jgi:hypothetical protein
MAKLLYVVDVTSLFRAYTDEPDLSFLTSADTQTYLEMGYNEFRQKVTSLAPATYAIDVTITPSGTSYNLATGAVKILGANVLAGDARLARLLSIRNATPDIDPFMWTGVSSKRALQTTYRGYYLEGQLLHFSADTTAPLKIQYVPESKVDWSVNAAGTTEYIDDLVEFHDIIALLAYKQYAIRDSSTSEQIQRQLSMRMRDLESTLLRRNFDGPHYVARTDTTYEDY